MDNIDPNPSAAEKPKRRTKRRGNGEGCIYKRHDGKWCAVLNWGYNDKGKRRRKFVYGETKTAVQEELGRLQSRKLDGTLCNSDRLTVKAFLDQWLENSAKSTVQGTTFANYSGAIENHICPAIGGMQLARLAPNHVQGMYAKMEEDGASAHTRKLAHAVLHRACKQALRWGMIARNPVDAVDAPRAPKKEASSFSLEQCKALVTAAKGNRLEALYVLAVTTGMRLGELLGLQWDSVDLQGENPSLTVKHALKEIEGKLVLGEPKTAKSRRRVELSQLAVDALWDQKKRALAAGQADGFVFRNSKGGPIRRTHFRSYSYIPLLKAAKLPFIKFHSTRHTAASLALADGESVKLVSEMLGHSDASITLNVYAHVLPTQHRKRADRMGEMLKGAAG